LSIERLEAHGVKSAGALFKGLNDSGLSGKISSNLYYHEKAHADADDEGRGEFGFIISGGWVIAYYLVHGDRDPEQMMKIASAPGFSQMSNKDWDVYKRAWHAWKNKLTQEKFDKKDDNHLDSYKNLREYLVGLISEKLDHDISVGNLPELQKILGMEFEDLIGRFGQLIYQAYSEALSVLRDQIPQLDIQTTDR